MEIKRVKVSEVREDEEIRAVCMRVSDAEFILPGSNCNFSCMQCGKLVVISPSTFDALQNKKFEVMCIPCGTTPEMVEQMTKIMMPTKMQVEEFYKHMDALEKINGKSI